MKSSRILKAAAGPASGFSLVELMAAMLILGVVSTFTIPKVLQANQASERKAKFKEAYAAIYQIQLQAIREGVGSSQFAAYVLQRINAVKICPDNAGTQGCYSHSVDEEDYIRDGPGFVLASGTAVAIHIITDGFHILIDVDGPKGPNKLGEDVLQIDGNLNPSQVVHSIEPMRFRVCDNYGPSTPNRQAYFALWQR